MRVEKPQIKWIGTDGDFYPNRVDRKTGKQYKPIAIVMHIMQGTLAGTASHFNNPNVDASTHLGVGLKGEIHQYVDLKDGAWGNGAMAKPDLSVPWIRECWEKGINPNLVTISIEHEGKHDLQRGIFHQFTDEQYEADIRLVAWLHQEYGIPIDREHIVGHYQIDGVNRPYCPGPTYDFNRVIEGAKRLLNPSKFKDTSGHWAQASIDRLASIKTPDGTPLLSGFPDGTFRPDEPLTRAQAASLMDKLLKIVGK